MALSVVWVQENGQVGELVLDAVISRSLTLTATPTSNPVEEGIEVTDHVQVMPIEFDIEGAISNTPIFSRTDFGLAPPAQDDVGDTPYPLGQPGRAQEAKKLLQQLHASQTLVTVLAPPDEQFENMLIQSVSIPDEKTDMLKFTVHVKELRIVRTQLVKLPATKSPRGKTQTSEGKKATPKVAPERKAGVLTKLFGAQDGYGRAR
jgi:hypothetical protein